MPAVEIVLNDGNVVTEHHEKPQDGGDHTASGGTNAEQTMSAVLHRSLHHDPLRVVAAKGHYLQLSNDQRILDATGGAAVSCLGHGNER